MTEKVGFIGLGIMGSGMAANILARDFDLVVWSRTSSKTDELVRRGARKVNSPAEVAAECTVVLLCVTDEKAVHQVLFGSRGVVESARPGTLIIDMSTIPPQASSDHAKVLAERGLSMLDAPVSGSREGADQGTLSIMVGGDESEFERALKIFEAMGNNIVHVGNRCGNGQTVKLVNQLLASGNTLVMCEALLFAQAGGVDLEKTLKAVSGGAAGSWMLTHRGPQVIRRDWQPGFTIDLQLKSVSSVLQAADDNGVPVPLMAQLYQYYRTLQAQGKGQEGHHALVKALENLAGFKVGPVNTVDTSDN
jgi:3-hydroxyisobutyrate dehydrogenase